MVPDPAQPALPLLPDRGCPPVRAKVRLRFAKAGDLRFVSHHDLMRCFERMLRRAELPFRSTQGFNPKPRLVFALSLPLGVVGREEVVELELDAELPPEEIHRRLAQQAPPGLVILSVRSIARAGAQVRRVTYRLPLNDLDTAVFEALRARAAAVLATAECWVDRTRTTFRPAEQQPPDKPSADRPVKPAAPRSRRIDLRPYLSDLRVSPDALEMDLWVTPTGTARPQEVLAVLGLSALLDAGAVLERTRLELHDEDKSSQ
jgi:radical SAM-linked protein